MTTAASLPTWDVLKEFGFLPDDSVMSDIQPGLSIDFGNLKLTASAVLSRYFKEVVMFGGVLATSHTIASVVFEIPRLIESREVCAALLTWFLDKHAGQIFEPQNKVDWLEMGRENRRLLPWIIEKEAYDVRPQCSADKEITRATLKALAKIAEQMLPDEKAWFSFDGEVLKIRAGKELLAIAAHGKPWSNQYGLNADQLTKPPRRLMGVSVVFEYRKDYFVVANCHYHEVVIRPMSKS